ncbi:hypothetical protein HOF56_04845 [Candidatus Peribacteria bacterium]|jgi:hypothetical protein|nr:hypothetical protein [Candidatus Peribacteria bacterium]MBT4021482.1 hypothetical protein [Candidatus Peribacteria bacterium]MBT4240392.1 hypothetical protein [Candidatus Peribacteria bacterium]MBT4473815.1 hypothetical protein [Candidatus Peribacteria bacterium]
MIQDGRRIVDAERWLIEDVYGAEHEEANNGLIMSLLDGGIVISFIENYIDGGDREYMRKLLDRLFYEEGHDSVSINMSGMVNVESGFFGMLDEWRGRGREVHLLHPSEFVRGIMSTKARIEKDLKDGV